MSKLSETAETEIAIAFLIINLNTLLKRGITINGSLRSETYFHLFLFSYQRLITESSSRLIGIFRLVFLIGIISSLFGLLDKSLFQLFLLFFSLL